MMLRKAIVIDNNDTDKKDKIKVRILPEMKDVDDNGTIWISPLFENYSNLNGYSRNIPEIDNYVYVLLLNDLWKQKDIKYINLSTIKGNIDYTKITDFLTNITDKSSTYNYPQPNYFEYFPDGSFIIRNTESGEYCIFHNNGGYILFEGSGKIFIYSKDKDIKLYNDNGYILLDNSGKLEANINSTFSITDGNNNILESTATSIKINNNLEVLI